MDTGGEDPGIHPLIERVMARLQEDLEAIQKDKEVLEEVQEILNTLRDLAQRAARPDTDVEERLELQNKVNVLVMKLDALTTVPEQEVEMLEDMHFSDGTVFQSPKKKDENM